MADVSTAYASVSVKKKTSNAGRAKGKKNYIVLFNFDDVDYTRDEKGVRVTKLAMRGTAKPIGVYATDSTIKIYHTSEGDNDAKGFTQHVEFEHPGTDQEILEFVNNNVNGSVGAIVFNCDGTDAKIAGEPCTPLKFSKADSQDDKDADKNIINLASVLRGNTIGLIAKSLIPVTDNADINAILGLTTTQSGL
ncbi:MAG: hypothetical protein H6Q12_45 [Bacteroidetes bacterium]|nr:hypothetical protein [Bacteroidota bacterium]